MDYLNLQAVVHADFHPHPFSNVGENCDFHTLLSNYLAMSQAFPLLQAGSQKELIFNSMLRNKAIPKEIELTCVVANFLCWDETGGLYPTIANGLKALPRLLETQRFHANILRSDCVKLLNQNIEPNFSPLTTLYLVELYAGLSSLDHIVRLAHMVSFELHAHTMISALWESLIHVFGNPAQKLPYFMLHVGGEDPAERYHVEMTQRLIEEIVKPSQREAFESLFKKAYALNQQWCTALVALSQKATASPIDNFSIKN